MIVGLKIIILVKYILLLNKSLENRSIVYIYIKKTTVGNKNN